MPVTGSGNRESIELGIPSRDSRKTYHVVFDGVQAEMESLESFSIKFGLLTNMPVTKIKHLTRRLPATIWSGQVKSKAAGLVNLIEEAGGVGRLVVEEPQESAGEDDPLSGTGTAGSCRKCGFPLKKEDEFCQFCMTSVDPGKGEKVKFSPTGRTGNAVSHARVLFYLLVVLAAVVITLISRI